MPNDSVRRSGRESSAAAGRLSTGSTSGRPSASAATPTAPLPPLNQPKYTAPEPTLLCRFIVFPIYDRIVVFYPHWWTPNGITLFGIFCTFVASLMLLSGMPSAMPDVVPGSKSAIGGAASGLSATASRAVLNAGQQFLKDAGIMDNSSSNIAAEAMGMWFYNMHRRVNAAEANGQIASPLASSPKGLYGKPIALLPNSVTAVSKDLYGMATSAAPTAPQTFSRPVHFVDGLTFSLPRAKVIAAFLWTNLTASADTFLKHNMDRGTYRTFREIIFDYVQTPISAAFNVATPLVDSGYSVVVEGLFMNHLPAALVESPGRLMLIVAGVLNLIYCIADNTDGRHARRTKRSSHIGEYLDHGLDCVTSLLSTFLLVTALGAESYYAAWAVLSVALVTVCCHIVHQEQGVMIWGNSYFSVDEAMLAFGLGLMAIGFWYPSYITITVPVEWLASTVGIPAKYIPASLVNTRVVEILLVFFVLSQAQVFLSIVSRDRSILTRPCSILMYANIAILVYFTNSVGSPDTILSNTLQAFAARAMEAGNLVVSPNTAGGGAQNMPLAIQQGLAAVIQSYAPTHVLGLLQTMDAAINLMFSYEAQWVVVAACTCSIIVHQPIISKCLHVTRGVSLKPMLMFLPLVWFTFFMVSSAIGCALAVVTHAIQVLWNIRLLENRARAIKAGL